MSTLINRVEYRNICNESVAHQKKIKKIEEINALDMKNFRKKMYKITLLRL